MILNNAVKEKIQNSADTALIDYTKQSDQKYRPSLVLNDKMRMVKVISSVLDELEICESFMFSVAFITKDGLALLSQKIAELMKNNIKGRIITTDYLNFSDPDALEWLLEKTDLDVRIFSKENFHTKGYIFNNKGHSTLLIGSSNLTQNALTVNKEWNLKITSLEDGELLKRTLLEFEQMWSESMPLTAKWIEDYRPLHMRAAIQRNRETFSKERHGVINPNQMQEEALCNLDTLRRQGKDKALLISATGTGKTYLSAFDVRNVSPKRVLFLVHREQILDDARESYEQVMGSKIKYGKLSGTSKDFDADILFSTINTMSKKEYLERFSKDHFDYIVCDEAHHSTASMYGRIIAYFKPKFMLGMTATPERMDDEDVFSMFDHNIAYELRLQKAMEMDMLCPFHYYGISDITVDGKLLDDEDSKSNFKLLTSDERVKHIITNAEYYSHSGNRVKGLIFCSRREEAQVLSDKISTYPGRNYRVKALFASNSVDEREEAFKRLEKDDGPDCLDYIISCDILNEGIDIPAVNQVIMLRPTQSSTIFIQQLGRGLRKAKNKDYVVVIDFIGNYANNFMIPVALSGDRSCNKDTIRRYLISGNDVIPGSSSVNFDPISKERIFESINRSKLTDQSVLKNEYLNMKARLGKPPTLMDLLVGGSLDPRVLVGKYGNLNRFRLKIKEECDEFSEEEDRVLTFISENFINGKRLEELSLLNEVIEKGSLSLSNINSGVASVKSAISILQGKFYANGEVLIDIVGDRVVQSPLLRKCVSNVKLREHMLDAIGCGIDIFNSEYRSADELGLVPYKKYSRKDVCRILNWEQNEEATIFGYRVKNNICPIFVTYNKKEDISETTKYDESFVDQNVFSWMTKSNRNLESTDVVSIRGAGITGLKIPFFINKSDDEGREFYYLGQVDPVIDGINQTIISDKPVVNIPLKFRLSVRDDIYEYFTSVA